MHRVTRLGTALVLASCATPALAECQTGWRVCTDVTIAALSTVADGRHAIFLGGGALTLAGCPAGDPWLYLDATAPGKDAVYAHLLAMHLQNKKTNVRIVDGPGPCMLSYTWSWSDDGASARAANLKMP